MARTLYTSQGAPVDVGMELGRGGEGAVFELPAFRDQVAKLYHNPLDAKKQAKLRYMATTADAELLSYIAWPKETLHQSRGGPVLGFMMPKVSNRDAIHKVYSPAYRKQAYPSSAWDFLLFVARNIAASFKTVHAHGHVIGDVNQNSFMVGRDSKVVLIDSDSFQVNAQDALHFCTVGVPHFTPPELQSLPKFDGYARTPNHDNFGLALLIFHVLFGGRHPYSGVPLKDDVGNALEADIARFRYAYARDNHTRGFKPPPKSIPITMLPDAVESMFHLAFTEKGASGARPNAQQWVAALDGLRARLKKCAASSMHVYPDHLSACPWCALDKYGAPFFVDLGTTVKSTSSGFILTQTWAFIERVQAPAPVHIPSPDAFSTKAQPLPKGIPGPNTIYLYRVAVIAMAIAVAVGIPSLWFLALFAGVAGWNLVGGLGASKRQAERAIRDVAVQTARAEFNQRAEQLMREAGPEGFHARKTELSRLKNQLEAIPKAEQEELNQLQATAHERQKQRYLDSKYISDYPIPGVGAARKAALRSFGIETAADVTWDKVRAVRGFGEQRTRAVVDWKQNLERKFQFNPATAITVADKNAVKAKFAATRTSLEHQLARAPGELQQYTQRASTKATSLLPMVEAAAQRLAQAQADLAII
jgi:DNA-binding helix-hairpin-helix protein with protein kinase domain